MIHTPDGTGPRLPTCAPWCAACHGDDEACWGLHGDANEYTPLSMEHGYPRDALPFHETLRDTDVPRIGVCAYRQRPGFREVVYLHLYYPHDDAHLDVDTNLKVTPEEALRLAARLIDLANALRCAR